MWQLFLGNTGSRVFYVEIETFLIGSESEGNTAFLGELQGIRHKIGYHLCKPVSVCMHGIFLLRSLPDNLHSTTQLGHPHTELLFQIEHHLVDVHIREHKFQCSGFYLNVQTCPNCGGSGKVIKEKCTSCSGTGYTSSKKKIEVTIPVKGNIIRSEQTSDDMYVSVDLVEEVIERQLRKYKNKLVARSQGHPTASGSGNNFKKEFFESEDDTSVDDEIRIVRTKRFGIKPMYPEDACIQMDLLGHAFFVFCNAETDEVNVVYKRKDGSFGLIEPEFS